MITLLWLTKIAGPAAAPPLPPRSALAPWGAIRTRPVLRLVRKTEQLRDRNLRQKEHSRPPAEGGDREVNRGDCKRPRISRAWQKARGHAGPSLAGSRRPVRNPAHADRSASGLLLPSSRRWPLAIVRRKGAERDRAGRP